MSTPPPAPLEERIAQLEMLVKKVTEENVLLRSAVVGLGTRLDRVEASAAATPSRRPPRAAAYGTLPRNARPNTAGTPEPARMRRTPSAHSTASSASSSAAADAPPAGTPPPRRVRASPSSTSSVRSSASSSSRTPLSRSTFHERAASETPSDDGIDPARKGAYSVGNRKIHYTMPEGLTAGDESKKAEAPADALELTYAFGFNGSARNNVAFANDGSGRIIYHVAGVGVVMDPSTREQRLFVGHNEDILALAAHPTEPLVATAQLDPKGPGTPFIIVWNYDTLEEVKRITHHDRGICGLAFSPGGRFLASIGMDDSRSLAVHDWRAHKEGAEPLIEQMSSKDHVFAVDFRPSEAGDEGTLTLVVLGVKLVKVFSLTGLGGPRKDRRIEARSPSSFGKTKIVQRAYHAVAFRPDGSFVAGAQSGHLYEFGPDCVFKRIVEAHDGVVGSVAAAADGGVLSVGDDGKARRWNASLEPEGEPVPLPDGCGAVRASALDAASGLALLGTKSGTLVLLDTAGAGGAAEELMCGHTGEVWAAAVHPGTGLVATGAHDRCVRVWDTAARTPVQALTHKFDAKGEYVRSAAFSPDGTVLAVGLWTGRVVAFEFDPAAGSPMAVKWDREVAKETVDALAFSPDGKFLAAGSWDQLCHILNTADGAARRPLRGHTSSVLMCQWSADSKYVMTNSRDYEILYFDALSGQRARRADVADTEWSGWSCFLGWPVQGIWEDCGDGTDINAVAHAPNSGLLAAGDDFGIVRLYRWPAVTKNAPRKEFIGHSSHVTNVRWTSDESHLVSCGGADTAVFVWSRKGEEEQTF